jgi:hypothetical protein
MSPGWQSRASQIQVSVLKRIALARPSLRIDRLTTVIPAKKPPDKIRSYQLSVDQHDRWGCACRLGHGGSSRWRLQPWSDSSDSGTRWCRSRSSWEAFRSGPDVCCSAVTVARGTPGVDVPGLAGMNGDDSALAEREHIRRGAGLQEGDLQRALADRVVLS